MKNKNVIEAPVLLITFNRPDNTRQVFEKIRQAKVKKLYIANDGPRKGNAEDINAREEIKKMVDEVDWDCEVKTLFQKKNLGCGWGPASAITWALENEDRIIILEDDCVPSMSFFDYVNYCLEKYKNDTRVWLVSGRSHHTNSGFFNHYDYLFTHYGHTWGWATWKRCWRNFDMEMKDFPEFHKTGGAENVFFSSKEGREFNKKYEKVYLNKESSRHIWDFQFNYHIIKNGGLSIVPSQNLIQYIGYYGTHAKGKKKHHILPSSNAYRIVKEPKFVIVNKAYDRYHFNNHVKKYLVPTPIFKRVFRKINKIIKIS